MLIAGKPIMGMGGQHGVFRTMGMTDKDLHFVIAMDHHFSMNIFT